MDERQGSCHLPGQVCPLAVSKSREASNPMFCHRRHLEIREVSTGWLAWKSFSNSPQPRLKAADSLKGFINLKALLIIYPKRFTRVWIIELMLSQAKGILRFYYRDGIFSQITFSNMCHHLRTTNPWEKWGGFIRRWLTFKEVATELQIPLKSIYGYHYKGIGPKVSKYGRHLRVLETDFIAWQEERAITGKL